MSGPDDSGRQASNEGQPARDTQFESARDAQSESARDAQQFESARDAQWQSRPPGQDPNAGGYPPAPGQPVNPYRPGAGTGSAGAAATGSGQTAVGQQGSGQYGSGSYGASQYGASQYGASQYGAGQSGAGQYGSGSYNVGGGAGQYGAEQNAPPGGYPPGGYPPGGYSSGGPGGDQSAAGLPAAGNPGNAYPPPPVWGQGNAVVPDQFQSGHYPPGTPRGEQRQQRSARSVNPEKALGVAVAVLGGLNFVFGFLPQYTGGSTTGNFSVYAVGPGYVPILLLIAGLLALAAFVPGSERSRLAVAAVSVGGAVGAVISIGTTSPGTASLGTGMGAILLTVFGIVQAVIAIGGYVVGTGIAPRSTGSSAPDPAGPGAGRLSNAPSAHATPTLATPADPGAGGTWAGPQGAGPGWPGVMPGQPPAPPEDQRGGPGNSWQATGQRPDQPQWRAERPYPPPAAEQPYGSPSGVVQPTAAGMYASPSSGQPSAGETYGRPAYSQPTAGQSFNSPTYAGSHAGESYFGQASAGQNRTAEPAPGPPQPSHFDPAEPATGPQPVVGVGSPWSSSAADNDASRQTGSHRQDPEDDRRRTDSESDVVNLAKPTEPPPTAR